MFGKKKDQNNEISKKEDQDLSMIEKLPKAPQEEIEVHAMPKKFLSGQPSQPKKKKPKLLIILIAVVLILLLSVGAALLFRKIIEPGAGNQPTNLVINENTNAENANIVLNLNRGNINDNQNGNENFNINSQGNENSNINANISTNQNTNLNTNSNRNYNTNANVKIPSTKDTDGDGLTDDEEELFVTEVNKPDTDSDGYLDGVEVKGGYSPIGPGLINKTDLVKTYANNSFNYSIIYPAGWLARAATSDNAEVLFTSETVEFVQITVVENVSLLTIKEWYLTQFPEADEQELIYVSLGSLLGIMNPDGQTIYIAEGKYIYSINYNTGLAEEANFFATFAMIYDSFTVTEKPATNGNSNTNANSNRNANSNQNKNTNLNSNQNSNTNVNSNANLNSNSNRNQNTNTNSNQNKNTNQNTND